MGHIPGTTVPIGAVVAQQQAEEDSEALLLLLNDDKACDLVEHDAKGEPAEQRVEVSSSKLKPLVQQGKSWGLKMTADGQPFEIGMWQGGNAVLVTGQLSSSTQTPSAMDPGAMLNVDFRTLRRRRRACRGGRR